MVESACFTSHSAGRACCCGARAAAGDAMARNAAKGAKRRLNQFIISSGCRTSLAALKLALRLSARQSPVHGDNGEPFLSGPDPDPPAILGRAGLRPPAT